nr:hypothetical protein CFP56_03951 [Quercus suber]
MSSRSIADIAPTATTMALNAYIFGFGEHSIVTPHEALKQLWWTDRRIDAKVTRSFINSKFRETEREYLSHQLSFGEGLTDGTYIDWILQRSKRLFLILAEIGVPDQIFGCIDHSWDDEDLPITLGEIRNLELSLEYDEALNRRFYDMQFVYLLRELRQGEHIDYGHKEHIPMEHVNTIPPAVSLQIWDRIHFPKRRNDIFTRRKCSLSDKRTGDNCSSYEEFYRDVLVAKAIPHKHIAAVWGSYTFDDAGYVISDFVGEHTLQTFLAHRTTPQYLRVAAVNRPALLCQWIHCLSGALAFIHFRGLTHGAITPSNIIIDSQNQIAFADIGSLRTFGCGKKFLKQEMYDYAAPEQQICQSPHSLSISSPEKSKGAFGKLRVLRSVRSNSSRYPSCGSSVGNNSDNSTTSTSLNVPTRSSMKEFMFVAEGAMSAERQSLDRPLLRRPIVQPSEISNQDFLSSLKNVPSTSRGSERDSSGLRVHATDFLIEVSRATPQQSDIFSFACIMLEVITFVVKGKLTDFVKHRSTSVMCLGNTNISHADNSFHENSDKVHSWIQHLLGECEKHASPVFQGFPALLDLIRQMMAQDANRRPTAHEVRSRLNEIFTHECGILSVCCNERDCSDQALLTNYRIDGLTCKTSIKPKVEINAPVIPMFAGHRTSLAPPTARYPPASSPSRAFGLSGFFLDSETCESASPNRTT